MSVWEIKNRFKRVLQLGTVARWRRTLMLTVYRQSSCLQLAAHQKHLETQILQPYISK
jgi:hypothetical protein